MLCLGAGATRRSPEENPMSADRIASFEEFWPYYVREHSKKTTRTFHFVGTTIATAVAGAALLRRKPALVPLALVCGYGPAWISHFFIEKNRPATFKYPLWSLLSDYRMWGKIASGTMDEEVARVMDAENAKTERASEPVANGVAHADMN
jgi:hypothetical protein